MFEAKPVASLTAGLLARKGEARPAVRRSFFPTPAAAMVRQLAHKQAERGIQPDHEAESPLVRQHQARIARSFARARKAAPAPALPRPHRAAFTLRIDTDRHLRLRLACAVAGRSAQKLITEALDAFLDQQQGLEALTAEVRKANPA